MLPAFGLIAKVWSTPFSASEKSAGGLASVNIPPGEAIVKDISPPS
jgi:hypothetical protein